MQAPTISERLAQYASGLSLGDIPGTVRTAARRALLDTLAVGWAGTQAPGCDAVWALQRDRGGKAESTVWGHGTRLPAPAAALVNGTAAAALEYDGLYNGFHADSCVVPAAIALAERQQSTGAELLTAQIVGTDVGCRLVAATGLGRTGWWDTPLFGAFGACAAAISLLRLPAERGADAFGLVYARTGGTMQLNTERSLAKRVSSGMAAAAGIDAALLAAAGVSAPRKVFEGRYGLFRMFHAGDESVLLDRIGAHFSIESGSIKAYPCCACTHTAIAATRELMVRNDLRSADIETVRVSVSPYVAELVGAPFDVEPHDQVGAQFSIRYAIACAIRRGRMGLADLEPSALADPAVRSLTRLVSVEIDPSNASPRTCVLTLRTTSGTEFTLRVDDAPGDPASPMRDDDFLAKMRDCLSRGTNPLVPDEVDALIRSVEQIDSLPSVDALFSSRLRGHVN